MNLLHAVIINERGGASSSFFVCNVCGKYCVCDFGHWYIIGLQKMDDFSTNIAIKLACQAQTAEHL